MAQGLGCLGWLPPLPGTVSEPQFPSLYKRLTTISSDRLLPVRTEPDPFRAPPGWQ